MNFFKKTQNKMKTHLVEENGRKKMQQQNTQREK